MQNRSDDFLCGLNLGGWLVPERWITPSLYDGDHLNITRFAAHKKTFIRDEDFGWLAKVGINAVRIPVPYTGVFDELEMAMASARRHGLKVLIDLHTAPGSQNGWDHSGGHGELTWHTDQANIDATLNAVESLAKSFGKHPALWGIEVLNEPRWDIPHVILHDYYSAAYTRIRSHCGPDVAVIISDAFRPWDWTEALQAGIGVVQDTHLYQVFSDEDKALNIEAHLHKVRTEWAEIIKGVQQTRPIIVGEWSIALDHSTYIGMDKQARNETAARYGRTQLSAFSQSAGWFYWTYKTEANDDWNFKYCVKEGLIVLGTEQADNKRHHH